jgi:hypothetical protein
MKVAISVLLYFEINSPSIECNESYITEFNGNVGIDRFSLFGTEKSFYIFIS